MRKLDLEKDCASFGPVLKKKKHQNSQSISKCIIKKAVYVNLHVSIHCCLADNVCKEAEQSPPTLTRRNFPPFAEHGRQERSQ